MNCFSRRVLYIIIGLSVLAVLLVIALIGALAPDKVVTSVPVQERVVVLENGYEEGGDVYVVVKNW